MVLKWMYFIKLLYTIVDKQQQFVNVEHNTVMTDIPLSDDLSRSEVSASLKGRS